MFAHVRFVTIEDAHLTRNFRVFIAGEEVSLVAAVPLSVGVENLEQAPAPIVLRRAVTGSRTLWSWFQTSLRDSRAADVAIDLYDARHDRVVARWVMIGARPVRWTGPQFDALAGQIATEELEVSYQELEWAEETD